jgi:hypothetical protein
MERTLASPEKPGPIHKEEVFPELPVKELAGQFADEKILEILDEIKKNSLTKE